MKYQTLGDKPNFLDVNVKNGEASVTILRGQPVGLKISGTDDGLVVVLPNTNGAPLATSFFAGVALQDLTVGKIGNARVFGMTPYTIITRATRAATSDSWTSSQSLAIGALISVDTVNNAFLIGATGGASAFLAGGVLAQTVAVMTASATATSDTRTVITTAVKAFLRTM